ncbi:MAG: hypothetical protein R3F39_09850 [Myxococcota bacterium]
MRVRMILTLVGVAVLLSPACSKQPAATPAAPAAKTAPEVAPAAAVEAVERVAEPEPAAAPVEPAPAAVVEAQPVVEAPPADPGLVGAEEAARTANPPAHGDLSAEECASLCEYANKLTMAAIPEDAKPEAKAAIQKTLEETCPRDCLAKGTKEIAECIRESKSAWDLASCPQ